MKRATALLAMLVVALGLGTSGWAGGKAETIPFDNIEWFFEFNFTDQDLGVQLSLDAEPFKRLQIFDPCGVKILDVKGKDSLKEFGMAQFFFESNEPNFDEIPKEDILDLFPAGTYTFIGRTIEGDKLFGKAKLTHKLPRPAVIVTPAENDVVDPDEDLLVRWLPVTRPRGIKITSYQLIVTNDDDQKFALDVRVGPDATSFLVPAEFLQAGVSYELEILAVEKSGNQTISLIFFETEED